MRWISVLIHFTGSQDRRRHWPALGLYLLSAANYVPNVEQTAEVITMMKATISLVPAVFTFITSLLIFIFYKLSESEPEKIRQALQERREKQEKKS